MDTRILRPSEEAIEAAAETLRRGGLVAIPTETVYGLAGSAFDERAVGAIFAAKDRPVFDPLIVHVGAGPGWASLDAAGRLADLGSREIVSLAPLSPAARDAAGRLLFAFWPGPLTLVLPRHRRVPLLVTSGLDTVAVRMPGHPVAQALLSAFRGPVAAPSANRFGRISPTTADDVVEELRGRVGIVLDGGPSAIGVESTIVRVEPEGSLALLRPGGIPEGRIADVARAPLVREAEHAGPPPASPGRLPTHYAPAKPLVLLDTPVTADAVRRSTPAGARSIGLLLFSGDAKTKARSIADGLGLEVRAEVLSPSGDLEEAARRLFGCLRALDATGADLLIVEPPATEEGLGHAIADRLRRAAGRLSAPR